MPEKGRWVDAEFLLREASRQEDAYLDGDRDDMPVVQHSKRHELPAPRPPLRAHRPKQNP